MTMIATLPEEYPHEDFLEELDWALEGYGFFNPKTPIVEDDFDDLGIESSLYEWDDAHEAYLTYLEELEERRCEEQELAYEHLPKTGKMRLDSCRAEHKGWYYRRRELIGQRPRSTQRWNIHRRTHGQTKYDAETFTTTFEPNLGSKRGHRQSWKRQKRRHQFEGRGHDYGMFHPKLRDRNTISQFEQELADLDVPFEALD